jgi:hypothetical protein
MRQFPSIVIGLVLATAACGGGDGEPDSRPAADARQNADAPPPVPDAPPPVPDAPPPIPDSAPPPDATICLATADYGAATGTGDNATHDQANDFYNMSSAINADPDAWVLQLYAGFGPFTGGAVTTGTFAIAGDDTNFATCGVCGLIAADVPASGTVEITDPERWYLAQSGTVTITSLSPNLTGTVTNLVLAHVTLDSATGASTVVGDCTSTIGTLSFNAPVTQQLTGGPIQVRLRRPVP